VVLTAAIELAIVTIDVREKKQGWSLVRSSPLAEGDWPGRRKM